MIKKLGYGSWIETPHRKKNASKYKKSLPQFDHEIVRRAAKNILENYIREGLTPVTVRQLYYLMVSGHVLKKTESHYRKLSKVIVECRRNGTLIRQETSGISRKDWGWDCIRDETYDKGIGLFGSVDGTNKDIEKRTRQLDYQQHLEDMNIDQPLIWCESAGLVPQISEYAHAMGAPVYSSGGFDSLTSKRHVGCKLWKGKRNTLVILHVGDKDRQGDIIFESLKGDVDAFAAECKCNVRVERIAVTTKQIEDLNLQSYIARESQKTSDGLAVKVEAINPFALKTIVKKAIEGVVGSEYIKNIGNVDPLLDD